MSRSNLLIICIVLAMGWAVSNSLIPRSSDPRLYGLGELEEKSLGSIKVPRGWVSSGRVTTENEVRTNFVGRYHKAPRIQCSAKLESVEEPEISEMERRTFLYDSLFDETYYDHGNSLAWKQFMHPIKGHVIEVQIFSPRNVRLIFTDPDNTNEFESTVAKIVDSYSLRAANVSSDEPVTDVLPDKPTFTLSDVDRKNQSKWAMGVLAFFLSLLLLEKRLENRERQQFEEEFRQKKTDELKARLTAQGTPFEDVNKAEIELPNGVTTVEQEPLLPRGPIEDRPDASEDDVKELLDSSLDLRKRKRTDTDSSSIPFDD